MESDNSIGFGPQIKVAIKKEKIETQSAQRKKREEDLTGLTRLTRLTRLAGKKLQQNTNIDGSHGTFVNSKSEFMKVLRMKC